MRSGIPIANTEKRRPHKLWGLRVFDLYRVGIFALLTPDFGLRRMVNAGTGAAVVGCRGNRRLGSFVPYECDQSVFDGSVVYQQSFAEAIPLSPAANPRTLLSIGRAASRPSPSTGAAARTWRTYHE